MSSRAVSLSGLLLAEQKRRHWTERQCAKYLKIPTRRYKILLSNQITPQLRTLQKLGIYLKMRPDVLVNRREIKKRKLQRKRGPSKFVFDGRPAIRFDMHCKIIDIVNSIPTSRFSNPPSIIGNVPSKVNHEDLKKCLENTISFHHRLHPSTLCYMSEAGKNIIPNRIQRRYSMESIAFMKTIPRSPRNRPNGVIDVIRSLCYTILDKGYSIGIYKPNRFSYYGRLYRLCMIISLCRKSDSLPVYNFYNFDYFNSEDPIARDVNTSPTLVDRNSIFYHHNPRR
jgi:hypothetical protein